MKTVTDPTLGNVRRRSDPTLDMMIIIMDPGDALTARPPALLWVARTFVAAGLGPSAAANR
jgi:hypothetical protein